MRRMIGQRLSSDAPVASLAGFATAALFRCSVRPGSAFVPPNRLGVATSRMALAAVIEAGAGVRVGAERPVILYPNGSAGGTASARFHRALILKTSRAARIPAFAPDYRLVPGHPSSTAGDDVRAEGDSLLGSRSTQIGLPLPVIRSEDFSRWICPGAQMGRGDTSQAWDRLIPGRPPSRRRDSQIRACIGTDACDPSREEAI
jgi:hypothetical protein